MAGNPGYRKGQAKRSRTKATGKIKRWQKTDKKKYRKR